MIGRCIEEMDIRDFNEIKIVFIISVWEREKEREREKEKEKENEKESKNYFVKKEIEITCNIQWTEIIQTNKQTKLDYFTTFKVKI